MYIDMYVCAMGTRTIAVSDEVYTRLKALKRGDESYTELLNRLAGRPSLTELAGLLSKDQAAIVRRTVEEGRERSRARRLKGVR